MICFAIFNYFAHCQLLTITTKLRNLYGIEQDFNVVVRMRNKDFNCGGDATVDADLNNVNNDHGVVKLFYLLQGEHASVRIRHRGPCRQDWTEEHWEARLELERSESMLCKVEVG